MKHTPGPWEYSFRENCCLIDAPKVPSYGIAMVGKEWATPEESEVVANARLIAAAPDLLDICLQAIKAVDESYYGYDVDFFWVEKMEAIADKARGE